VELRVARGWRRRSRPGEMDSSGGDASARESSAEVGGLGGDGNRAMVSAAQAAAHARVARRKSGAVGQRTSGCEGEKNGYGYGLIYLP
jgi:hypothetical protein